MPEENNDTIYGFSSMDDVVRVDRTVRAYEQNGQPSLRYRARWPRSNNRPVIGIYNDSGLTIPPFGVILLKGSQAAKNGPEDFTGPLQGIVPSVKFADTYGCQYNAFVADEAANATFNPIGLPGYPDKSFGAAQQIPPFIALYDGDDGDPAVGDRWGPRVGFPFLLKKNTGGFLIIGVYDATNKYALVLPEPMLWFRGHPKADIASGFAGDVKIFYNGVDTGVVMPKVLNDTDCTVRANQNCTCEFMWDISVNPWQVKIFHSK